MEGQTLSAEDAEAMTEVYLYSSVLSVWLVLQLRDIL